MKTIPYSVRRRWEAAQAWAKPFLGHASCKKGCSACCRSDVVVMPAEAEVLLERMRPDQKAEMRSRVRPAETVREGESASILGRLPFYRLPCVFLDPGGVCSVYAFRPTVCRTYMVASDPIHCSGDGSGEGFKVAIIGNEHLIPIFPPKDAAVMLADWLWERLHENRS